MPRYLVEVTEYRPVACTYVIEAETEAEARDLASRGEGLEDHWDDGSPFGGRDADVLTRHVGDVSLDEDSEE